MKDSGNHEIAPGITISPSGQATVDSAASQLLFDLAIALEEPTDLPVDVEHVLAAVVLADRSGRLDRHTPLTCDDPDLIAVLVDHVKTIFDRFDGIVGQDD